MYELKSLEKITKEFILPFHLSFKLLEKLFH